MLKDVLNQGAGGGSGKDGKMHILLILDSMDYILANNHQFDWNIFSLISMYPQVKFIVISKHSSLKIEK